MAFTSIPCVDMTHWVNYWNKYHNDDNDVDDYYKDNNTTNKNNNKCATLPQPDCVAADVAQQVGKALHEVGFVVVTGTGMNGKLMDDTLEQIKRFFNAPRSHKMSADMTASSCYRGYESIGEDKEAWEMGRDIPSQCNQLPLHGPNVWPTSSFDNGIVFKQVLEEYYKNIVHFARCLLGAICYSLGLSANAMQGDTIEPLAHLRMWRYIKNKIRYDDEREVSLPEHTDHGFLTLLFQDGSGGLQARNRAGEWIDVPPQRNSLVINTGRLLSMWTSDFLPSTFHRVINDNRASDRYSLAMFFALNYGSKVVPLERYKDSETGKKLESVICGEYINEGYTWQGAVNAGASAEEAASAVNADYKLHEIHNLE